MKKTSSTLAYTENRLAGLHASTQARKQETVHRLAEAIEQLKVKKQAITAQAIYAECGLSYASIVRNAEALALFRANSTHLTTRQKHRKRKQATAETPPTSRDPLMNYKKPQLVTRLRTALQQIQQMEQQQAELLDTYLKREGRLRELEMRLAELEPYRSFVEEMRNRIRREEQGGGTPS